MNDLDDLADRERRLCEVLATHFEAVKAGHAPDQAEWLADHPDLAGQLAAFLAEEDRLLRETEPLRTLVQRDVGALSRPAIVIPAPLRRPSSNGEKAARDLVDGADHRFGDYELLHEIARGGMGIVYRARQTRLNRVVALKILPGGPWASRDDMRRFRLEAEAIASLDHPSIVPIHEVGELDGFSYFAMKLIEGSSLARCLPEAAADPRAAAQLVAIVARAIHHAHQRGVLHRDLKPSNILIDAQGQPHVTDFSLAKRVGEDPELTQSGAILGTPAYMAPEQASGRRGAITTATDVHGLGTILYAVLTGKPPFRGGSVAETLEQAKEHTPEPPRLLNAAVDSDLQTICLKCLEKEPERRYRSALDLADDLERWLQGDPIQARLVRRLERIWLWCRRNPVLAGLMTTTALLLTALSVGAATGTWLLWQEKERTRHALGLEKVQRQIAQARAAAAEESRARARRRSESALSQVNELLFELLSNRWSSIPGIRDLRSRIAQRTIRSLEQSAEECRGDPTRSLELAVVLGQISAINSSIGAFPESRAAARRVIAVQEARLRETPDELGILLNLASIHGNIGSSFFAEDRASEAVPFFREAISRYRQCMELRPGYVGTANLLAWLLATCPCTELREPAVAVELARTAVVQSPKSGSVWNTLGVAQYRAGDPRSALDTLQKAMAMKAGGDGFDWFFVAMACSDLGRIDEARTWYDRAVAWTARESPGQGELRLFHDEAAAKLGLPRPVHEKIDLPRELRRGRSNP